MKNKKMYLLLFCGLLCLTGYKQEQPIIASGTAGELTWELLENGTLIISGKGAMPDYEFPNPWGKNNYPWYEYSNEITNIIIDTLVTSVGNYAFYFCIALRSITIPNSVTSIGEDAFYYCAALKSITIPNSVTSIGNFAFGNCWDLKSVTIPNSVTSIGIGVFSGCTLTDINVDNNNATYSSDNGVLFNKTKTTLLIYPTGKTGDYTIPNSIIEIRERTFANCIGLTAITIPNSVISIGRNAFERCTGLASINVDNSNTVYCSEDGVLFDKTKTTLIQYPAGKTGAYTIPNSVTFIYDAFTYCTGLTSVTIPNSVIDIGSWSFQGCTGLTSVTIPNSVKNIWISAFDGCSNLTSVTIGNSVSFIGMHAFKDCHGLTSITIPNSVTSINYGAFSNCHSLTSVTIGNSVKDINDVAFGGCYNLNEIINKSVTPQIIEANVYGLVNISVCTLRVPAASLDAYRNARNWRNFGNIVAIE